MHHVWNTTGRISSVIGRRLCRYVGLIFLTLATCTQWASAAPLATYRFSPSVISGSLSVDVRLIVDLGVSAMSRVELVADWGQIYALRDDGSGADAVAGDGKYTVQIPAAALRARLTDADVFRVKVGTVNAYGATSATFSLPVVAQVHTLGIPNVEVRSLESDVQLSPRVINVVSAQWSSASATDANAIAQISKRALGFAGDNFDFVNIVFDRGDVARPYQLVTGNDVSGIGRVLQDQNTTYGSLGRLQGVSVYPSAHLYDGASVLHQRLIARRWAAQLTNAELKGDTPSWPTSTMAFGPLGVVGASAGESATFTCKLKPEGAGLRTQPTLVDAGELFTPLDLYLMGLSPVAEVPDQWVVTDAAFARNWRTLCDGRLLTQGFSRLTLADVVRINGRRLPEYLSTQRTFNVATVVVSETPLPRESMHYYDFFAARADAREALAMNDGEGNRRGVPFSIATSGKGALRTIADSSFVVSDKLLAVEYRNTAFDYYFLTAKASEQALLDAAPDWERSGQRFAMLAYPNANTAGVVRFYFDQSARGGTRGNHFYSLLNSDIAALSALNPDNARLLRKPFSEGVDSYAYPPAAIGSGPPTCGSATTPVLRLFRGPLRYPDNPNHRFTTNINLYNDSVVNGAWDGEGVVFCAPK